MSHRLLLADDSITIQKVVELVLAEEDFEIRSVSNGEDAMQLMDSFRPDIVLADIEMPKMNGYQLCERIKTNPGTSHIPVILLAGAFEPIDDELAQKVRADDSVVKPFESQELISKINAALTLREAAEEGGAEEVAVFAEEAAEAVEAEALEVGLDEDLWSLEEVSTPEESTDTAEEWGGVMPIGVDEAAGDQVVEEPVFGVAPEPSVVEKERPQPAVLPREVPVPSKEELIAAFERTVANQVSSVVAGVEIKEMILASLMPAIKDSVERVLWEVAPDLVEKMLKEILKGSIASLTSEVEKVIWETVPDLAESMISKEIERIKSEF